MKLRLPSGKIKIINQDLQKRFENRGFHHRRKKQALDKRNNNMWPRSYSSSLKSKIQEPEKLVRNPQFMESTRVYPKCSKLHARPVQRIQEQQEEPDKTIGEISVGIIRAECRKSSATEQQWVSGLCTPTSLAEAGALEAVARFVSSSH